MDIAVAAVAGALLWIPVYLRRRRLVFTAVTFLMVPIAVVLVVRREWILVVAALVPGVLGILVDAVTGRFRRA